MQAQPKAVQQSESDSSEVHPHDESGVRSISVEDRAAIDAIPLDFALTTDDFESGEFELPYPKLDKVCPKMLEAHLPLVHQVVAQIFRRVPANVLHDDLLAAGIFGLVDSLRRNGGDSGQTFEGYARTRIRGAVLDELRAQDWLTRRARDAVTAAAQREDRDVDTTIFVGLDEVAGRDELELQASTDLDPEAMYAAKETMQRLIRAVDQLPDRERLVIYLYYFEEKRFKEIGIALGGVTEPRVSQLHSRALGRLKCIFEDKPYRTPRRPARAVPGSVETDFAADDWDQGEDVDGSLTADVA